MTKQKQLPHLDDAAIALTVGHSVSLSEGEKVRAALRPYRHLLAGHRDGTAGHLTSLPKSRGIARRRLAKARLPAPSTEKLLAWAENEHPQRAAAAPAATRWP